MSWDNRPNGSCACVCYIPPLWEAYIDIGRGIIVPLSTRRQSRAPNTVIADGPRFFINIVQPKGQVDNLNQMQS